MKNWIQLLVYALLLVLAGCKGCEEEVKPDPCVGKRQVNTNFIFKMGNRGFAPPGDWCDLIPTDTFNESSVIFRAPFGNQVDTKYEWRIGSEAQSRFGSGFELSFSDYLDQGNWEKNLPVTLTITTPKSECLENPADTLIIVTRNLFFTNTWLGSSIRATGSVSYRGVVNGDTKNPITLTIIRKTTGRFRGVEASEEFPLILYVGTKYRDTLMGPTNSCGSESCGNYKHKIAQFYNQETCFQGVLTNHMQRSETIYLAGEKRVRFKFEFWRKNAAPEIFDFTGEKI